MTLELTATVVASYIGNHQVAASDLPALIRTVYAAFGDEPEATATAAPAGLTRTQIRKSVRPDAIVSFEDGRAYKLLRRHLTVLGLTPQSYREKWGLPADYPMVAPAYHERRSTLAKTIGLGRKPLAPEPASAPPEPAPAAPAPAAAKRARKPRAAKPQPASDQDVS
jgi:predicted transcriptional regulator